jgi:soluble lytic murein transglycosylase-like protein
MLFSVPLVAALSGLPAAAQPAAALQAPVGSPKVRRALSAAAARSELPWYLLAGLCWCETRCRPGVRSRRTGKSWGLLQLRVSASTNTHWAGRERQLLDPVTNLRIGTRQLKRWRRFHRSRCRGDHPWWSHWQWGVRVRSAASGRRVWRAAWGLLWSVALTNRHAGVI